MITIRKNIDRGHATHGWLDARHTFSFANYRDPEQMGFRALRVINEDRINPGTGFATHPHKDMEIITYVLEGAVAHKDSTGGGGVIKSGMVQYMSAGSGVTHSEYNASKTEPLHLLQIWLLPNVKGAPPRYEERTMGNERDGAFTLIASADGRDESFQIRQDVDLYGSVVRQGRELSHKFAPGRYGWLQIARGAIELPEGSIMQAGDGARIEDHDQLSFKALADSEILLFDLS